VGTLRLNSPYPVTSVRWDSLVFRGCKRETGNCHLITHEHVQNGNCTNIWTYKRQINASSWTSFTDYTFLLSSEKIRNRSAQSLVTTRE
jgi:hypothetical protein